MKVLFINPSQEMGGIQALSAYLRMHGHTVYLIQEPRLFSNPWIQIPFLDSFFNNRNEVIEKIIDIQPDIIAMTVVADDFLWAFDWSRKLKNLFEIPIVFGNVGPTFDPEFTLKSGVVDFVVKGEGELVFLELLTALENKLNFSHILGLSYVQNGQVFNNNMRALIQDLDSLPFPDKDIYYELAPYFNYGYTIMSGRGCPYKCTFCDNNSSMDLYKESGVKGKWTRRRSPENVIEELKIAKDKYKINHIRFNDEDFSYSKKWSKEFCRLYKESGLNIPWFAWVYPNTIDDEIAQEMADAGCVSVEMGIQSGSSRIRNEIMHRRTTDLQILNASVALKKAKIHFTIDIILGTPTETIEDLDSTINLILKCDPDFIYIFWMRFYDSTEIYKMAKENSWISKDDIHKFEHKIHQRGHLGGGTEFEKCTGVKNYYTFLMLMPALPLSIKQFIIKYNLVTKIPVLPPMILINFAKIFTKRPFFDEFDFRVRHMYKYEIKRIFKLKLTDFFKKKTFS